MKIKYYGLLLLLIGLPSISLAEYCNLVGCKGDMYWVWIPKSQYTHNSQTSIQLNKDTYVYNRDGRLFKEDSLPEVNEVVTLNRSVKSLDIHSCRLTDNCSDEVLKRFERIKVLDGRNSNIYNREKMIAKINESEYQGAERGGRLGDWNLNQGAKLQIMSYQYVDDVLFALVRYIDSE